MSPPLFFFDFTRSGVRPEPPWTFCATLRG